MLHLIWAILIQIIAALNSYLSRLSPLTTLMTIQKHFANHDRSIKPRQSLYQEKA